MRTHHIWVRMAVRRSDLLGRPVLPRRWSISMALPREEAFLSVRIQDWDCVYDGSFRIPFGSRVSPVNNPPQANVMSDFTIPWRICASRWMLMWPVVLSVCQICLVMYVFLLSLCCPFVFHLENDAIWWRCVLFWVCFVMDHLWWSSLSKI
jgi:hypothetical protein